MISISFLNLPHQLLPQTYPLRARFNGVRESELSSFEGSAGVFDQLKTDEILLGLVDSMADRIDALEIGDSVTGVTYNGAPLTLEGLLSLSRRLENLESHLIFLEK